MSLVLAGISAGDPPATLTIAGIAAADPPNRLFIAGISAADPPLRLTLAGIGAVINPDDTLVSLNRAPAGSVTLHRKDVGNVVLHRKRTPMPLGISGDWMLDFEDNFTTLNTAVWTPLRGYDASTFDTPFNPTTEDAAYASDHVTVTNSELILTATPDPHLATNGTTYPYTSGVVNSEKGYTFLYGVAESRIAVPVNTAWWPAWWMCAPNHWPPEIDIAEFFPSFSNKLGPTANTHWDVSGTHYQNNPVLYGGELQDLEYHTYSLLWEPTYIQVFFDGHAGPKITNGIPNEAMYFIYNLGLHQGYTPSTTSMKVDYLRVWQ